VRNRTHHRAVFSFCMLIGVTGCADSDQFIETAAAAPVAATERSVSAADTAASATPATAAAAPATMIAAAPTGASQSATASGSGSTVAAATGAASTAGTASSIPMSCTEGATATSGPYVADNNVWGKASVTGPFSQCAGIGPLTADGSVSARWTWSWPSGSKDVKGYPELVYGQKPGHAPTSPTKLPMQVNAIRTATSTWATKSTYTGTGQLTFDLWLTRDAARHGCFNCTPITHEIMVVLESYGGYGLSRNPAWFIEETTIDGQRYKVYKADNFGPTGWRFIVLQSLATRTSGTVDFVPILNYLKTKRLVVGDEYLSSVEFGTEPIAGTGDVLVQSYSVQVQ